MKSVPAEAATSASTTIPRSASSVQTKEAGIKFQRNSTVLANPEDSTQQAKDSSAKSANGAAKHALTPKTVPPATPASTKMPETVSATREATSSIKPTAPSVWQSAVRTAQT